MKPKGNPNPSANRESDDFPGYPHYGKQEDIYRNQKEEQNIDPEKPNREKKPAEPGTQEPAEFIEGGNQPGSQEFPEGDEGDDLTDEEERPEDKDADITDEDKLLLQEGGTDETVRSATGKTSGDDLDVPGAELDDDQEALGSEDEENNYYSLGGDNHEK